MSMTELRMYEGFLRQLLISSLKRIGVCVITDFLHESLAESVREEIENTFK